jgi:hypothetical protein
MTLTPVPRESEQAAPTNALNALYGPVSGERFPIPAVRLADIHPEYLRKTVFYPTREQPGTISAFLGNTTMGVNLFGHSAAVLGTN